MDIQQHVPLAPYTTLHVGGPAREFVRVENAQELVQAVREADACGLPVLVLGKGSNILVADTGFDGRVVQPRNNGITLLPGAGPDAGHEVRICCEAGTSWDDFVAFTTDMRLSGVAALSGIPGCIGSAVMQNIGAYGQEMKDSLLSVRVYDRHTGSIRSISAARLQFSYRCSLLRENLDEQRARGGVFFPSPRWIVLEASFGLSRNPQSTITHPQLARALGVEPGDTRDCAQVREQALAVRGSKAMLAEENKGPDGSCPVDYDRWSSGSFFTNPLLTAEDAARLPEDAPRYPAHGGVKTSAAWLIEQAGFSRGFGVDGARSRATLSSRHTLALTNRGSATAQDLLTLARAVRGGVHARFGVWLEPETVLVGAQL